MDSEAQMILEDTVSFCERDGLDVRLINMLKQCVPESLTDDELIVEAPSRFAYAYLMKQRAVIERYLEEITFMPLALTIKVALPGGETAGQVSRETPPDAAERAVGTPPQVAPMRPQQGTEAAPAPTTRPVGSAPASGSVAAPAPTRLFEQGPRKDEDGKVKINNTISPRDLEALIGRMSPAKVERAQAEPAPVAEQPFEATPDEAYAKFTFENFVYGDENKHAYNSAALFAAMAEEPGSNTSLFIYGNSGLGKTHLLLAIKNYLNEHSPHLRVKYANAQAYIDDFINEVALQKNDGRTILREYHEADILIIDDIQNIIGKTASIDYFFRLMDEFIRNNKKVAIASDRAPKNLGMDERLTSRFNAGMLCLVSEPGFEMKLTILKRYYENTVLPASEAQVKAREGNSLLSTVHSGGGHLTKEQLDHMARVSGTNIRELESFCERCAGASFEAEQEGRELTGDDIDRIANEYFDTARKRISIETVQRVVEDYYHVSHADLIGPRRTLDIKNARHVAVYLAQEMCETTLVAVGAAFGGRDHSTVMNSLKFINKRLADKNDRGFADELAQLRNKIILRS